MKRSSFIPFVSLFFLSLTSCGGQGYLGKYSFQMGRDKGVHVAATIELTNEDVLEQENVIGKAFTFTVDLQTKEEKTEEPGEYDFLIGILYTALGDGTCVKGYYRVGEVYKNEKHVLHLGFSINESVKDLIRTIIEDETADVELRPELIEKIVFSTIDTTTLYITAPVSGDDLLYQLYWYGYDIYQDENEIYRIDYLPEEKKHDIGSHPTSDEVALINSDTQYKERHKDTTYRDYHTLSLGLIK